jgi:hypothetical protein
LRRAQTPFKQPYPLSVTFVLPEVSSEWEKARGPNPSNEEEDEEEVFDQSFKNHLFIIWLIVQRFFNSKGQTG